MPVAGRFFALSVVALVLGAGAAWSQERAPAHTTDEIIGILRPDLGATRSLTPSTGSALPPGAVGSGVLPDLKILFPFNSAELTPQTTVELSALLARCCDGAAWTNDQARRWWEMHRPVTLGARAPAEASA